MPKTWSRFALGLVAACTASSGVAPDGPEAPGSAIVAPPESDRIPCAVDAVLDASCRSCHASTPQFGAPMPLTTLADLRAPSRSHPDRKVYELLSGRIADDAAPMPPRPNAPLSSAARSTLDAWVAAGAPEGTEAACRPEAPRDGGAAGDLGCSPDLSLAPAQPYAMPAASGDVYACYGVEVQRAAPTHVVAFTPRIDNSRILHHAVLFEADEAYPSAPQPCSAGGSVWWRMVFAWAPGGSGLAMPKEAGFPIKTTGSTHYVVQLHYSNPRGLVGETDRSGFDLCTSAPRPNEADVLAFGTQSISIPPRGNLEQICSITVPAPLAGIHVFAAVPHMHKLGTAMSTTLSPGNADLGTVKNFSFDTQAWQPIDATVKEGDRITTRCSWTNPSNDAVSFGERTQDEMCYSFTLYYPKIALPVWSWVVPAARSTCE